MQHVSEHVDAAFLDQPPPRSVAPGVVLGLAETHLFRRRLAALDPWAIIGVLLLAGMWRFQFPIILLFAPIVLLLWRVAHGTAWLLRRVRDDMALLRNGLLLTADVQHVRPHHTPIGDVEGALLDCEIAVAPRRVYRGSVWLADGHEAMRLAEQGRLAVLCLPRAPGTWRVIEQSAAEMRYELMGPMLEVPTD